MMGGIMYDAQDFLEHHGIKGMRWGIRNDPGEGGRAPVKKKQLTTKQKVAIGLGAAAMIASAIALGTLYSKKHDSIPTIKLKSDTYSTELISMGNHKPIIDGKSTNSHMLRILDDNEEGPIALWEHMRNVEVELFFSKSYDRDRITRIVDASGKQSYSTFLAIDYPIPKEEGRSGSEANIIFPSTRKLSKAEVRKEAADRITKASKNLTYDQMKYGLDAPSDATMQKIMDMDYSDAFRDWAK